MADGEELDLREMMDANLTHVPAHPVGATPCIVAVIPAVPCRAEHCETRIHVGVFFDGTGNNHHDEPIGRNSNVSRLFHAYPDIPNAGYFPAYVPGIGTRFPEIGEYKRSTFAEAFGQGGDGRINFGLLHVINAIHSTVSPTHRLYATEGAVKALCRNGALASNRDVDHDFLEQSADFAALRSVGMESKGGLLLDASGISAHRLAFFKKASRDIARMVRESAKPKVVEIFVDVFGFSRGAAEARTFCNWLTEIFDGSTLCGVPATLRFLGLFDTVASVGLPTSAGLGGEGHASWADAPLLRIPPEVKNCVHFVAMREWLLEYLTWRYQVRMSYPTLDWAARARRLNGDSQALKDLEGANQRLLDDVAAFEGLASSAPPQPFEHDTEASVTQNRYRSRMVSLEREAPEVYELVRKAAATPPEAALLFADYCHDSYAGFRPFDTVTVFGWDPVPGSWEPTGYLRWRRRYEGDDRRLTRRMPQAHEQEPLAV